MGNTIQHVPKIEAGASDFLSEIQMRNEESTLDFHGSENVFMTEMT